MGGRLSPFSSNLQLFNYLLIFRISQGSVLGLLLFVTFVNDIDSVMKHASIFKYANDITMYFETKHGCPIPLALAASCKMTWTICSTGSMTDNLSCPLLIVELFTLVRRTSDFPTPFKEQI